MRPVAGSNPVTSTICSTDFGAIAQLGERLHGMQEVSGSIPLGSTNQRVIGCLAQLVERRPYKTDVGGSIPSAPTNFKASWTVAGVWLIGTPC